MDERLDVDAEEVDRFLYYCFRNCPPADVLLLNETLYEDALEKRLKASENDLGELGLELLAKLKSILEIQYEAEEGKADLWVRKVEEVGGCLVRGGSWGAMPVRLWEMPCPARDA